ncbi:MAG TPA: sodium/calcium exchanger protein [Candidatus Eisenbacteria bacterium]|nr:sodium/calcium exchanger protein [Candidatus Eisenbacteria bacterium]
MNLTPSPADVPRAAWSALWTFPAMLMSAFVVAWGAEAAQFYVSQGLALALLAWIQVLPEFAVEAVIAWHRDVPLMTANFTGAVRLLTGLGWPVIWGVHAVTAHRRGERGEWHVVRLDREHAVEVVGLVPPLLLFVWIVIKGRLGLLDAGLLLALYAAYLIALQRVPPREHEEEEELSAPARAVLGRPEPLRALGTLALFLAGAALLYVTSAPFLSSMLGLATLIGVSQFVFVQWMAPFLSEFPEFTSTTYWARRRGRAGMALMNLASSNINQWTVLAAMIPIAYSLSLGRIAAVPLASHRLELTLTLLQSALGCVLLSNFRLDAYEAVGMFVLWLLQFLQPEWRLQITWCYGAWLALELGSAPWRHGRLAAFAVFPRLWAHQARVAGPPAT